MVVLPDTSGPQILFLLVPNYIGVCFNVKPNYLLFLMPAREQYGNRTEPAHDASEGRFLYDGDSIDIVLRGKQ